MGFSSGSNSANYSLMGDWNGQDGNVTTVGSNGGPSYYGTYDQSGNLYEWNDLDGLVGSSRGLRGGSWFFNAFNLSSSSRLTNDPSYEDSGIGFRLSSLLNPLNLPYFVSVGDVNNSNDSSTLYGSVNYVYSIGQYLVTNCEYAEFLNAVASTDTYNLYKASMSNDATGGITISGISGSYSYSTKNNMSNKPVTFVNWFDCARYCNWLHNGKGSGDTETGAYTLSGATSGNAVAKNSSANYHIPTENEWYKAAYYKGGGTDAGYWLYATQSDSDPFCVGDGSTWEIVRNDGVIAYSNTIYSPGGPPLGDAGWTPYNAMAPEPMLSLQSDIGDDGGFLRTQCPYYVDGVLIISGITDPAFTSLNGFYCEDGTENGKVRYTHNINGAYVRWTPSV